MRMFFCHNHYMVFDRWNAKNALGSKALRGAKAAKGVMAAALSVCCPGKQLQRAIVRALKHLTELILWNLVHHVRIAFALGNFDLKKAIIVRWV